MPKAANKARRSSPLRLATLLLATLATPVQAGWAKGLAAYEAGDFAAALHEWTPLAEGGDVRSQEMLGYLYDLGEGVREDDATAAVWYRLASEQGSPEAQTNLGMLFVSGSGQPRDFVAAFKWLYIASQAKDVSMRGMALDALGALSRRVTPAQIAEGRLLARAWSPHRQEGDIP